MRLVCTTRLTTPKLAEGLIMLQRPQTILRSLTTMTGACLSGAARIIYPHQHLEGNSDSRGLPSDSLLNDIAKEIVRDWRKLGVDLGLSQATIDNIDKQPNKDEQDKSREMLITWKRALSRDQNGHQLLIDSLGKWGRNDLIEIVENKTISKRPLVLSDDVCAIIVRMLGSKYSGHRIVTTSLNGEVKFELSDLFTPLDLTKKSAVSTRLRSHMQLLDLRNTDGDKYKQILVRGPKGCGKTALLKAISQDWAKQNQNPSSSASKYDFVFSIDLQEVSEGEDLVDAVFKQLLPDDITDPSSDSLRSYLENPEKQSRVAVLLDGLDSLICCGNKLSSKVVPEYFYKLIMKKVLRESLVIVVSRTQVKKLPDAYQIVDVGGFSEGVTAYVEKFFKGDEAKVHYLKDVLESYSPDLRDFARSPNIAQSLCELLVSKGEERFPTTLTSLYDKIFHDMVRLYQSDICLHGNGPISYFIKGILKSIDLADVFPTFHNPVPVRDQHIGRFFHDFGKVALRGLLEKKDLEESDFGRLGDILAIAKSVGLLVKDNETAVVVRFCHPSMQEYFASKYCQGLSTSKQTKFKKKIESFGDLVNLYRFCCGGNEKSSDLIMRDVVPRCMDQDRVAIGKSVERRVALACLTESHSNEFLLHLVSVLTKEGLIEVECSSSGSCLLHDLGNILARADGREELESVHTLKVSCEMNTWCIRRIDKMVQQLGHLQTVSVVNNSDQRPFQVDATLHPVNGLACSLRRHHLSQLTLVNCGLDSRCLTSVLSQLPDLQSLDLSSNPGIWSGFNITVQPPRLTTLKLRQCEINRDQAGSFVQFLHKQPDLVELDMGMNDLDTSSLGMILDALGDMGRLQIVAAERKRSDGMILPHEATIKMLRRRSTLRAFNVSRWELKDEEAGAEMLKAVGNLDDFQALTFNERSFIVDESGNAFLLLLDTQTSLDTKESEDEANL